MAGGAAPDGITTSGGRTLAISWATIVQAFTITAGAFLGLSVFGYTTKKDLSGWGSFLIMGLIGLIVASIINIFLGSLMQLCAKFLYIRNPEMTAIQLLFIRGVIPSILTTLYLNS